MKKILHCCWFLLLSLLTHAQTPLSGIINHYASVSDIDYCSNQVTVSNPADFSVGTSILLIQMQGATITTSDNAAFGDITELGAAGRFERTSIRAINGNILTLENALVNTYDLSGSVQIVDIPIFENAEVTSIIEPMPWNGTTGGILALEVNNTLTFSGFISADGKGFRGGVADISQANNCNFLISNNDYFYGLDNWRGAAKGEGIAKATPGREAGRGAQANGGGGGNDHNAGGGGGSNSTPGGNGGRNEEPRTFGCDGNFPGIGGKAIAPVTSRIYLGGGGGAGHENNEVGTNGGAGGGIIFIKATNMEGNNQRITARGESVLDAAAGDGAGGGGAGGTILLDVVNVLSPLVIDASGGLGGKIDNNNENRCHGPGGGGSGGRVMTSATDNLTISVAGGAAGETTNSTACPDGATNGAQPGNDGVTEPFPNIPMGSAAAATPGFTSQPQATSACIGEPVTISAAASGSDLQYQWQADAGNGFQNIADDADYSGSQTPELTINDPDPGLQLRLLISNNCTSEPIPSDTVQVMQFPLPSADFDFTLDGLIARFTNNSANADSFIWDFGDGSTSTETNPEHTYAANGTYEVTLRAINACDTVAISKMITFQTVPIADFAADTTQGCVPFTVRFSNLSSNDATNFRWVFPGGTPLISNDQSPEVTYETEGTFNVILIATNAAGSDTTAFANYITANAPPVANFDFVINTSSVDFTSAATGADRLYWDFGDGSTSTDSNPTHTYADDGDYTAMLSAINACDSVSFSQTVRIRNPPAAAFTANVTEGCAPLVVNFSNASSDNATSFTWLLEGAEPAVSNEQNPDVTYAAAGTYDVTLIVANETGADTLLLENYITVRAAPRADYFFDRNGFAFNFTDNSRNADRLLWDFGDGNTSTETNPMHTYASDGTYQITLSAINACDSVSFSQTVTINTRPSAGFSVSQQQGCVPFAVDFQNTSSGNADRFTWVLPGATPATSTDRNPSVTYNTAGTFDVTLIVGNAAGQDTLTIRDYIAVSAEPVASFAASKNNRTFTFTNNSRNGNRFTWNFGDGNGSSEANPMHTYALPGNYTVTLTVSNACGSNTQTINVTAGELPTASFTANRLGGCAPVEVNFRDVSRGVYEQVSWEFPGGDPVLSSEANPTVRYDVPGMYDVILTVNGALGESRTVRTGFIEVLAAPSATFNVNTITGNTVSFSSNSMNAPNLLWTFGDGSTSTESNPTHTYVRGDIYNVTLNASNAYCSRSVTQTISIGATAVEDLQRSGIKIFPNPVQNYFFIQTEHTGALEYRLFSLIGQELQTGTFLKNKVIDVSDAAGGTYLLQLRRADKIWIVKMVKQ